jgi:cytochrome c biogenesis protein
MFYIRERRLWCWLTPAAAGATQSLLALSASRPTIDLDGEFQALSAALTAPT